MSEIEKILLEFYEENKQNKLLLSKDEISKEFRGSFLFPSDYSKFDLFKENINDIIFGFKTGLCFTNKNIIVTVEGSSKGYIQVIKLNFNELDSKIEIIEEYPVLILGLGSYKKRVVSKLKLHIKLISQFNNQVLEKIKVVVQNQKTLLEDKLKEEDRLKEQKRLKDLKESQTNVLSELDKDGNGIIDVIEGGDDFMKLFRKHQSVIKEFDKEYINHLVKISNYLKTKRNNIQEIFLEIRKTKNQSQLEENVGLLKNQIHTYEVVLFHSLSLITSIVEDDLITVNEIYEEFDKLKMFKTDHEKEVSQKLSDIGDGLSSLMYSINSMERNIVSGLNTLSYVTEEGFSDLNSSLSRELQSIDSSIQSNNLLTGIQTYQLYKINKQTKGLIG